MNAVVGTFMGLTAAVVVSVWVPWFAAVGVIVGLGFIVHLACTRYEVK